VASGSSCFVGCGLGASACLTNDWLQAVKLINTKAKQNSLIFDKNDICMAGHYKEVITYCLLQHSCRNFL
jgi:hypothetical protein